jgi:hypothetical protein
MMIALALCKPLTLGELAGLILHNEGGFESVNQDLNFNTTRTRMYIMRKEKVFTEVFSTYQKRARARLM